MLHKNRSFFCLILVGTLLLMLPVSSRQRCVTGFDDAMFTAVSATCVTGLVVKDTATYWSLFGQAVILMLIQIGGIGIQLQQRIQGGVFVSLYSAWFYYDRQFRGFFHFS